MPVPSFALKHTLIHHTKPVNSLSISSDGALLASGGDDGLIVIWDIRSGRKIQVFSLPFYGPICVLVWTPFNPHFATSAFALGSANGAVQLYRRSHKNQINFEFASLTNVFDKEVEGMAYDHHSLRLATVGSGCLKVWNVDEDARLSLVNGTSERPYIARSVAFFDRGQAVLVAYLESHEVVAYNIDPWEMKWTYTLRNRIGCATISADERLLITSNLKDAVDTYSIPPIQHVQSLTHPIHRNVALGVSSALDGALTIAGSDDGSPRLFDQRVGTLAQTLPHGNGTLVQAVTAHSVDGRCTLATGSSEVGGTIEIKLWSEQSGGPEPSIDSPSPRLSLSQIILILVVMSVIQMCISHWQEIPRFLYHLHDVFANILYT